MDTRSGAKVGAADGNGAPLTLNVLNKGGLPGSGIGAVALNVTVVSGENPTIGGGYVTVYPCGTRPDASNLNFTTGQTIPNSVIAPVSASGDLCFYVYGTAHLLADVSGYFPTAPPTPTTTTTAATTTTTMADALVFPMCVTGTANGQHVEYGLREPGLPPAPAGFGIVVNQCGTDFYSDLLFVVAADAQTADDLCHAKPNRESIGRVADYGSIAWDSPVPTSLWFCDVINQ